MLAPALLLAVDAALERRHDLLQRLHGEGTDCYRLFHGIAEGEPGLTIDRYGPLLLLQTFRGPLSHDDAEDLGAHVCRWLDIDLHVAANHRLGSGRFGDHAPTELALQEHHCREANVRFLVQARHRGQDPWLFLDLRQGRKAIRALAKNKSVLNLFSYTCGVGVMAAVGGALEVANVDFAESALAIGQRNAAGNGIPSVQFKTLTSDCIPVLRQLAGKPVMRRGRDFRFVKIEPKPWDLVFLDPPRWAKGPFGAVDVVRDYASLFKPCLLTLADGGAVVATNHVPEVTAADFLAQLRRIAEKAGRPLKSLDLLAVDADFPAFDGNAPLKVAVCRV
jgi:23S rRNA (cytosine1962-C5)-methyltransferase